MFWSWNTNYIHSRFNHIRNNLQKNKEQISQLQVDAKKSSKILGVKKTIFYDYPDNELDSIPLVKIVKTIEKIVSKEKPDIVYTSHSKDLNIDHRITCKATLIACKPSSFSIKEILCFEIYSSTEWTFSYDFKPNHFVDIEKELNGKMNAMKKYKNEIRKFPHPRSLENIKNSAKRWGTVCGFNAAEAFQIAHKIQM